MQEEKLYDVSEVANQLHITTQAVYKLFKSKKIEKYVIEKDGKKYVNKAGFDILQSSKQNQEENEKSEQVEKQVANLMEEVANQKKEIEELRKVVNQLQTKVEKQESEVTVRLLDVLENQQKLQAMQMQNQPQNQNQKKGFFARLLSGE